MSNPPKDRFSFDSSAMFGLQFKYSSAFLPRQQKPLDDEDVIKQWRPKFADDLDVPNDEFEEILDWQTRFDLSMNDYLKRIYDGLRSGAGISYVLGKLEQEIELEEIALKLSTVGGGGFHSILQSLYSLVPPP